MSFSKRLTKKITDYDDKLSFGSRLRQKRVAPLCEMICHVFRKKGKVSIIDLGGTKSYWNILPEGFLRKHCVEITLVNLGDIKQEDDDIFTFYKGDACNLQEFEDRSFDIVHSNSVIEHVGNWENMENFANEVKRLASAYFVQTPNYWFPVEPHGMVLFYHWLPRPARIWMLMKLNLGHWGRKETIGDAVRTVERARLLNKAMFMALFNDAEIIPERILFLTKSYIALKKTR